MVEISISFQKFAITDDKYKQILNRITLSTVFYQVCACYQEDNDYTKDRVPQGLTYSVNPIQHIYITSKENFIAIILLSI